MQGFFKIDCTYKLTLKKENDTIKYKENFQAVSNFEKTNFSGNGVSL